MSIVNTSVRYNYQVLTDDEKTLVRSQIEAVKAVDGKQLSTNDYSDAEKLKLGQIAANAEENVISSISVDGNPITPDSKKNVNIQMPVISQSNWTETDETSDSFIKNKPTIPSAANNGTLSFKVNGESLPKTFGADSSENVEIELTDTQYQVATDQAAGLMSAEDKVKLDGIDEFSGSVAGLVPDATDAVEGSFLDYTGNWSVPAGGGGGLSSVYTDGVSVTGNGTANRKIAIADGYIVGTESQIDVSVNEAKTNLVVSPIIADAIEDGNESLVTSSMVAGAIGTNLSVAAGDGVNLTQDTEDAPLVISVQYPIVIEQNPSEFVPIDDGKLHFLVMQ